MAETNNLTHIKTLARTISLVENEAPGYEQLLRNLTVSGTKIIGVTGPPGAGKSTVVDALINILVEQGNRIGVLCIDPSSPFNLGALLGDRIRMSKWYNNPAVFIRSLATRGSLGGLTHKIIEITDIMKAAWFDCLIIETVGTGQTEVEIAGLADTTVVVLVPESGDEIQSMKSGLMEIADIFVVNKADRPGADQFIQNLRLMQASAFKKRITELPVIKTIATRGEGISELLEKITEHQHVHITAENRFLLLVEKSMRLIRDQIMKNINRTELIKTLREEHLNQGFNLYRFIENYEKKSS